MHCNKRNCNLDEPGHDNPLDCTWRLIFISLEVLHSNKGAWEWNYLSWSLIVNVPLCDLRPRLWTRPVQSLVAHSDIYWRLWRGRVCKVKGSEKKISQNQKTEILPPRQHFSNKIMAACVQLTGKTCANKVFLSHRWSPTVPRAEVLKWSKDLAKTNWG